MSRCVRTSAWSTSPSGLTSEQPLSENTTHDGNLGQAGRQVVRRATELFGDLGGWHDARVTATRIEELVTPALLVDADALEHNLSTMATALPGPRLRPHIKAHKCTALARRQLAVGLDDRTLRQELTAKAMELLVQAHKDVGGDVISAGGTGSYDLNTWANEIQAGSYALMDAAYAKLGLPFQQAASVLATVISTSSAGYAVANCSLKPLRMDHGHPDIAGGGKAVR